MSSQRPGIVDPAECSNNVEMKRAQEKARKRAGLRAVGQRLEALRRQKGWNRTTLATRAGVTIATVRGAEDGTKVTQPEKLQRIMDALGTSLRKLEAEESDPRVKNWTEEDYAIGSWYHHAPRMLKQRIWAMHEADDIVRAMIDPQLSALLEGWMKLTHDQKVFVLNGYEYIRKAPANVDVRGGGTADVVTSPDPKARGPQR